MFEVPVWLFPLQLIVLPERQEVSVMETGSPEHSESGSGDTVSVGVSLMCKYFVGNPVTTFPQASVTVGGETAMTVTVSQYLGQFGSVNVSACAVFPKLHPAGEPTTIFDAIQGCEIV